MNTKQRCVELALFLQREWGHAQSYCQYRDEVLYCACGWAAYADSLPDFLREALYQEEPFLEAR